MTVILFYVLFFHLFFAGYKIFWLVGPMVASLKNSIILQMIDFRLVGLILFPFLKINTITNLEGASYLLGFD